MKILLFPNKVLHVLTPVISGDKGFKKQLHLYQALSPTDMWSFSNIDALDSFILRVKWSFEVGLGLVRHSHPLQCKIAALYEVGTHLIKKMR